MGTLLGHPVLTFSFIAFSPLLDWSCEEKDCAIGFFIPAMAGVGEYTRTLLSGAIGACAKSLEVHKCRPK